MIKKIILVLFLTLIISSSALANTPKSSGKYKNWESFVLMTDKGKICFAQTKPVKRAPAAIKRDESRIFVTFRPSENVNDEISVTSGHTYKNSTVSAKSGKSNYSFFSQGNFAWIQDAEEEFNLIKVMKKASKLSISASTKSGAKTKDIYSMMGFTKAYNTAKKSCA